MVEMYIEFRKEIDRLAYELLELEGVKTKPIEYEGKTVGFLMYKGIYIDGLYIRPEYRRKGLGKREAIKFFNENGRAELHIVNNNEVALKFWNSVYDMVEIEFNAVDTLYYARELR